MTLRHLYSGKVRDIYELDGDRLLMVTSDRISAFDVVMTQPVRDKGRVLTAITSFWLDEIADIVPNHLISTTDLPPEASELTDLAGRAMLVRKAEMLPIECIVRGYLSGSAWKEYRTSGTMNGERLPEGLQESSQLPQPVFTPSTKAETGHDENITRQQAAALVGDDIAKQAEEISLAVYERARDFAAARGIIIADTKFELGFIDGELCLCDEVLTPDSSRFWEASSYQPGSTPPSFDKQPVRDWLEATGWDKSPPPPNLPDEVVQATRDRYIDAYERLSGKRFADWPGVEG